MQFLTGSALTKAIKNILNEPGVQCAVAFWGHGCDDWLKGKNARVICNLASGGTNPHALKELKLSSKNLKQHDQLHAKVFMGQAHTIVASANVSANGLGFEEVEQKGWIEAGVKIKTTDELKNWFQFLWDNQARGITKDDWKVAQNKWNLRQQFKPTVPSFSAYRLNKKELPVIDWWGDADWRTNEETVKETIGTYDKKIEKRIHYGCDIEKNDDPKIPKNKWILRFSFSKNEKPKSSGLEFIKMSDTVIEGAITCVGEKRPTSVLLSQQIQPPFPFDPKEKEFKKSFFAVLNRPKYREFLNTTSKTYYKDCSPLTEQFWKDVKDVYAKTQK